MRIRMTAATVLTTGVLACSGAASGAADIRAFDFGPEHSEVWPGFTAADASVYTAATGHGWQPGTALTMFQPPGPHPGYVGGLQDPLVADGAHASGAQPVEFCIDLPNGDYAVRILTSFNRHSFCNALWGLHAITAEGRAVWNLVVDKTNFFDIYFRDAAHTIDAQFYSAGVWQRYIRPWLDDWKSFDVAVTDGQLNLTVTAYRDRLHALVVAPLENRTEADAWIEKVRNEREKWFSDRWREEKPPATANPVAPSAADRERGYIVFARHWMEDSFPTTLPAAGQVDPTLKLLATPGEREPTALSVRALRDLQGVALTVSDLVGPEGARIPASAVEHWFIRCEARPYPGGVYKVEPVALEQRRGLPLNNGLTRTFFLKLTVPAGAVAGVYAGGVTIKPANATPHVVPIKVRVLPFSLAPPDQTNFCIDMGSLARYLRPALDDPEIEAKYWEWVRRYLDSLRAHNMTTIHLNMMPAVHVVEDTVTLDFDGGGRPYQNLNRLMQLYKEAGFTGPQVIYQGFMSLYAWGLRLHPARAELAAFESARGQALLQQAAQQVVKHVQERGWPEFILYATGEPTNFPQGVEKAIATFKALRQVPGAICAMSSITARDHAVFEYLDVILFGSPSQNNMGEKMKAAGKKLIGYNSGITRLSYGFYVWRIGASGRTQEHLQSTIQDRPFNDFLGTSSCWSYTHMAYGPEGVRPCPRVEHEAEGVDDYCYVLTLERLIAAAETKGGAAAAAAQAARELLTRIHHNVPDDMRVFHREGGHWDPGIYDRLRSRLANEIMALQESLR